MSERGIDVFEKYQGAINWSQVAGSGVKHALIKLTNGAAVASPAGDHYVNGAHGAGLRVGGYAYALGGDPVAEANVFANELLRLGALDDAPTLDYEDASVPQNTTAQGWIAAFFAQLKVRIPQLTRVLLYSSGSMLTRIGAGAVKVPGLTIMIFDAEYGANDGVEHPMHYYTGPVAIHQYTSAGHVPGISGLVDEDAVLADITEEQDMPLTQADAAMIFWGTPFDGTANFAQYLKGHMDSLSAQNTALTQLVMKDSPASAADIAAALQTGLSAQLESVVQAAVTNALGADKTAEAAAIATEVLTQMGVALTPKAAA